MLLFCLGLKRGLCLFLFAGQNYDEAIALYTKAIDLNPLIAIYYGNRSFAYLKTECFGYALNDASKAIELDRNYVKGYYRRAAANMSLGKFKLALKDYEAVMKARPSDRDAKLKFTECNKIVKKLAFEKAIAVDENKKSIADSINLEVMSKSYYFMDFIHFRVNVLLLEAQYYLIYIIF